HRRSLCRIQGRDRGLHPDRGQGHRPGCRALEGLSHSRSRGPGRRAAGHETGQVMDLRKHIFRPQAGRMNDTLAHVFGVHNPARAEDVVQGGLCRALEIWKFRGVPENPSAWLMTTAKNRALDVLRRERTARTFAPELTRQLESEWTLAPTVEEEFGPAA